MIKINVGITIPRMVSVYLHLSYRLIKSAFNAIAQMESVRSLNILVVAVTVSKVPKSSSKEKMAIRIRYPAIGINVPMARPTPILFFLGIRFIVLLFNPV